MSTSPCLSARILRKFTDGPDRYSETPQAVADDAARLESALAESERKRAALAEALGWLVDAVSKSNGHSFPITDGDRVMMSARAVLAENGGEL